MRWPVRAPLAPKSVLTADCPRHNRHCYADGQGKHGRYGRDSTWYISHMSCVRANGSSSMEVPRARPASAVFTEHLRRSQQLGKVLCFWMRDPGVSQDMNRMQRCPIEKEMIEVRSILPTLTIGEVSPAATTRCRSFSLLCMKRCSVIAAAALAWSRRSCSATSTSSCVVDLGSKRSDAIIGQANEATEA